MKKLWKQKKTLWKKYQVAVWIEVIFLCVMMICTGCLYWIEKNSQQDNAQETMKTIQAGIYSKIMEEVPVEEIRRYAVEEMQDTLDGENNVIYGIRLELYGIKGYLKKELTDEYLSVAWRVNTEEGIQTEWYDLDEYFSADELEGFFQYYRAGNKTGQRECYIKEMIGAYTNGKFRPMQITFGDRQDKDSDYVLKNELKLEKTPEHKLICRIDQITEDELADPEKTETGYFSMYLYDQRGALYNGANNMIVMDGAVIVQEETERNLTQGKYSVRQKKISGNSEVAGYSCAIYADINALVKGSGNLKKVVPPIWIIGQGLAAFLIWLYLFLQKKNQKLENMRNTFINAIAHEMKTPAAVIKNSTECLMADIHPEKQSHYIEMIGQEADHMNELLNSMLIYTRITDSVYCLQKEECMLEKIARDVCGHYTDVMEKKEISLIWDTNETTSVICDVKLMEMVLDNFISNAVKFCKIGGVIRISLVEHSISIYNEGQQIPEEEIRHIWEPMFRGDKSRAYESGSSGMGLAISEAILKMHRADYGVKNISGGVEFYMRIN